MPKLTPALPLTEPDPALLARLAQIERAVLAVAIALSALDLAGWLALLLGWSFPGYQHLMNAETAFVTLLCALSLLLSGPHSSESENRLARLFALAAVVLCVAVVCEHLFHVSLGIDLPDAAGQSIASASRARMSLQGAAGYGLLGISAAMMRVKRKGATLCVDLLIFGLLLLVLILISARVIDLLGITGPPSRLVTPSLTVLVLLLLTAVAFLRKAEKGMFSILLGHGIGSNIARGLAPLLLVLPYLRECARARIIGTDRMPSHYTTAFLASLAFILSFALLLYLAWRINAMELEIRDLSLRDALTDLYNVRGFRLLAEQSLRMARRSSLPFSVLFIDLDDLKRTNDTFGHQAGSDLLIETGRILKSSFRETDVLGRIGGDEFAVAGQFSQSGISLAAQRIDEGAARRNAEGVGPATLSFSTGYFTADNVEHQTLDELLARADAAMYEQKRRKKQALNP